MSGGLAELGDLRGLHEEQGGAATCRCPEVLWEGRGCDRLQQGFRKMAGAGIPGNSARLDGSQALRLICR